MRRPAPIKTCDIDVHFAFDIPYKRFHTHDIVPYVFDEHGMPLHEDEGFTVRWVESGIDQFGDHVMRSRWGLSVFDQIPDDKFEDLMQRIK